MSATSPHPSVEPRGLIVVAASAGGIEALGTLLAALPRDFALPIAIVQHRAPTRRQGAPAGLLARILARTSAIPVIEIAAPTALRGGVAYLAPADLHLEIRPGMVAVPTDGRRIRFVRSSANPLFESAAAVCGRRTIAVVLTGGGQDASDGVQAVKAAGGTVIAQDRASSLVFGMPRRAIETGAVDVVLPLDAIAPALVRLSTPLVAPPPIDCDPSDPPAPPATRHFARGG